MVYFPTEHKSWRRVRESWLTALLLEGQPSLSIDPEIALVILSASFQKQHLGLGRRVRENPCRRTPRWTTCARNPEFG